VSVALLSAALACFGLGVLIDVVCGVSHRLARVAPYVLALAGSGCLFALGIHATTTPASTINISALFGVGRDLLRMDSLCGLFLTLLFALGLSVSACFVSWVMPDDRVYRRGTASGYLLLLAAVAVIICAADAFTFLFAWETLTVSFYILTSVTRAHRSQASAAWATVGMGKVSGAALLFGFLLMAGRSGSLTFASWHAIGPGAVHDVAWFLVVVGFGAKVGLVPLQVWIPVGYSAAPGPARAAMAGIAANVGVYGLWRFLEILGRPPVWLVIGVLLAGGITALLGIAFAGVQGRLGRVIAYSSVENAGLIVTAYGVALTGTVVRSEALVAMGLLAATLQTFAHAIAKSALFVSLANFEAAIGTDELDRLRGIGRRMRWSGATFGAGALAMAGLPPTIGFVSEWFILEALMQEFRVPGLAIRLALAAAGALVALTTGLAALAFLRILGLSILGRPAGPVVAASRDQGLVGRAGLASLAVGCLGLAAVSPWEVRYIARGLAPVVPHSATLAALKSPWVLQPVFPGFSILSPSWLWVVMPLTFSSVLVGALILSRGRYLRVRRVASWHSATSGVSGPSAYSAFGFANPLRHVLANVLGTSRTTSMVVVDDEDEPTGTHVETQTRVVEPVETYLYRPLRAVTLGLARQVKKLQSGRLNAYVAYMLVALLIALALTAALR
jgi:formate hydrogenlyase subunit 3/multisubunit Na+/H+ antiporter MnhD subunit